MKLKSSWSKWIRRGEKLEDRNAANGGSRENKEVSVHAVWREANKDRRFHPKAEYLSVCHTEPDSCGVVNVM